MTTVAVDNCEDPAVSVCLVWKRISNVNTRLIWRLQRKNMYWRVKTAAQKVKGLNPHGHRLPTLVGQEGNLWCWVTLWTILLLTCGLVIVDWSFWPWTVGNCGKFVGGKLQWHQQQVTSSVCKFTKWQYLYQNWNNLYVDRSIDR